MGTSSSRTNAGGSSWKNAGRQIASRNNAIEAADSVIKAVLPALPNGAAKTPIYIGTTEAIKFGLSVREKGFEEAVASYAIGKAGSKAGSFIGAHLWNSHVMKYGEPTVDPTVNTILGNAFKQTFAVIGKKGAQAYG